MNPVPASTGTFVVIEDWILHTVATIPSTNPAAGKQLPAWHALRALTQTASYGRTGRAWTSDRGGLWLSANLPCPAHTPAERARWAILPLVAGWAVVDALSALGVAADGAANSLRLRWPNDIMVGPRKLAGLLVERFTPDTVTVGIGLNLTNSPERIDSALAGTTIRLADLLLEGTNEDPLAMENRILCLILGALRRAHSILLSHGFALIAASLNAQWQATPRRVRVTLSPALGGTTHEGYFHGVDGTGRLNLRLDGEAALRYYDATQIELLREQA